MAAELTRDGDRSFAFPVTVGGKKGYALATVSVDATGVEAGVATAATAITPGTPVTAGRKVCINCTVAGNVRLKLSNDSVLDLQIYPGVSWIDDLVVKDVVAGSTTATCTVTVLS